jgi:hypothetical protein
MANLKPYIDYLKFNKISEEETLELLKKCKDLTNAEKNIVYLYLFPRPLLDRELPIRVRKYRESINNLTGTLVPSLEEALFIVEAERTEQYKKFIHHIMIAFGDPTKISPVSGEDLDDCPICGKKLYELDIWNKNFPENSPEREKKEYLSFGSSESSVQICRDCLVQLLKAQEILTEIDPEYLQWSRKNSWDKLKM